MMMMCVQDLLKNTEINSYIYIAIVISTCQIYIRIKNKVHYNIMAPTRAIKINPICRTNHALKLGTHFNFKSKN